MRFFPRRQSDDNYGDGDDDDVGEGERQLSATVRSRGFLLAAAVLVLAVVGLCAWVAIGAFQAKSKLEQARTSAQDAKSALLDGDTQAASRSADVALEQAQAARDATHTVGWNIVAAVPWLGSPFKTGTKRKEIKLE